VISNYRNWPCHSYTMQVWKHSTIKLLLSLSCCCTLWELILPFIYHAGFPAQPSPIVIIIIMWLHRIGIGRAIESRFKFPGMIKPDVIIIILWLQIVGIGRVVCLQCRFTGMVKSKWYDHYWGGCKLFELVLPSVYHAGFQA
jgi:hypothetical protein